MKQISRFILVAVLILSVTVLNAQQKPKIVFQDLNHDFGTFKEEDGPQTTSFEFTNSGDVPLVLNSVRASCGCTTPKWTREPVAPGQKGTIQVSYNPQNRPGKFTKSVTVQSNAETPVVNLTISGVVEQREKTIAELYPRLLDKLRVRTNTISIGRITSNESKTGTLELVNDTDEPVTVGFKSVPPHIVATIKPEVIPPKGKAEIKAKYDASQKEVFGYTSDRIYLIIDGDDNYRNAITLSATVEEDFSKLSPEDLANSPVATWDSESFDFGTIAQDDKVEHSFELKNNGKRDLIIRNVRSSCGCTAVTPAKKVIPAGDSVPIKVVFDSKGKRGRQSKTITVITNDPKNSTTTLRISSNVETES
ncbi:MAG: DUF1573 domain-containing protein [Prolixibacteraceae bacterium]|nr:DUF1573 domain-containing protein [Prolixibacteraceae bacterium]MBN2774335.1 DUF1573 domain-containing protein [Prolixibacteraceae bacterium]